MRRPPLNSPNPGRLPRPALLAFIPVAALIATMGVTFALRGGDDGSSAASQPTPGPQAVRQQATATAAPQPAAQPTATAQANPDRTSCSDIRGTAYRSDAEQSWYQKNCLGAASASSSGTAVPSSSVGNSGAPRAVSSAPVAGEAPLGDTLVIARLNINAPVSSIGVPESGEMPDPKGYFNVALYKFDLHPGLGGYPGTNSNTVIAGHVDSAVYGQAVLWNLRAGPIAVGDVIDYYTASGKRFSYIVQWFADYPPDANWAAIVASNGHDELTIITCIGTFDSSIRQYSHRRVVRATLAQ